MLEEPLDDHSTSSHRSLFLLVGAAIGGLLLVFFFSSLLFCWPIKLGSTCVDTSTSIDGTQQPTNVGRGDVIPTPFQSRIVVDTPMQSLQVQIDDSDPVTLTVDAPATIRIDDNLFSIRSQPMDENGEWASKITNEAEAAWLNGTIVNYVLAIADSEDNRSIFDALGRNDEIEMETQTGITRRFSISSRELLPLTNTDIFAQSSPGITIVLVGSSDESAERYVLKARYVVEESLSVVSGDGGTTGNIVPLALGLGDTANLGNFSIRFNGLSSRRASSGSFIYELVDYEVTNGSGLAFDTSLLKMTLSDVAGNAYMPNDEATIQGNFAPLIPQISVGVLLPATVGYKMPMGLDTTNLKWIVERADSGESVEFSIETGNPAGAGKALIELSEALFSPDASTMSLKGQISNPTKQAMTIKPQEVTLLGGTTTYLILASTEFPWVIPAEQSIEYTVTFQRPSGAKEAIFTIVNQSFQLNGWQ